MCCIFDVFVYNLCKVEVNVGSFFYNVLCFFIVIYETFNCWYFFKIFVVRYKVYGGRIFKGGFWKMIKL